MNEVLAPLAARYASWLGLPVHAVVDVADEDPEQVRVMPIVLRIERGDPPTRRPAYHPPLRTPTRARMLEAAATAAIAVCLDPRAAEGGEWHDEVARWIAGRIRKVSRRARGAHWQAVQELPGVTVKVAGAEARALVPGRVVDTPKVVARLQISGSELPTLPAHNPLLRSPDDEPGHAPEDVPVLHINPDVPMTLGKAAAQVGHATMILASVLDPERLSAWAERGYGCAVRTPTSEQWKSLLPGDDPANAWRERRVVAVRDAGFTEVDPGTITVLAHWP